MFCFWSSVTPSSYQNKNEISDMKRFYNVKSIVALYDIIMMMILLFFETDRFASSFTHFCHILSKYSFIFGLPNKGLPLSALTQASTLVLLSLGSRLICLSPPSFVQLPGFDKITSVISILWSERSCIYHFCLPLLPFSLSNVLVRMMSSLRIF